MSNYVTPEAEPAFRCGWRVLRQPPGNFYDTVVIRRGQWKAMTNAEAYDDLDDATFAECMSRHYRESAFEQLEADLAVLARQVLGEMEQREGLLIVDGVFYDDVKAALHRYTTAERDRQKAAT
jgi:hypothetical protein